MLKIKDSVDLKELKKFGFVKYYDSYYNGNLYGDCLWVMSDKSISVSGEQDIEAELIDYLFDLIKADLVEKVEG